jgi:glycosyltransferase involved in cell wall biosynthesis
MNIALDCSSAARPQATGVAMYIRRLVEALGEVAPPESGHKFTLMHRLSRLKDRKHFVSAPAKNFRRKIMVEPLHPLFGRSVNVFHGLDARLPGRWMKAPLVVTIHDIFSALQSKEFATADFRAMKSERYADLVERADRIICVSEACKRDVLEVLKPDPKKLSVVYEAGGAQFSPRNSSEVQTARKKFGLERPYLIYVGSINKRKNIPAMVRAFVQAREKSKSDAVFALSGRVGYGGDEMSALLRDPKIAPHIKMLGYVPDEDVPALYSGAWGLLFATQYEGFGIPVVEASACGCPVIGGSKGSVPEILDGAGLLADPANENEIAAQIEQLLTSESLRAALKQKGLARAKFFSWKKAAEETLAIYKEVSR